MADSIRLKRIQDPVEAEDGARILVDRVWPRGVRKADAQLTWWLKELAPSTELRKWFNHDPTRWAQFRQAYRDELARAPETLSQLLNYCRQGTVTLLFGARDREHNQAVVLREVLQQELAEEQRPGENASPVCYSDDFPEQNNRP